MYKDNISAILLNNNGIIPSGNQTKHIRIRYFLIKDRIAMGDLKVEYCPTGNILEDYFTKPFQGAAFQKFRTVIQGISEDTPFSIFKELIVCWDEISH